MQCVYVCIDPGECENGEIRLTHGGSNTEGYVEVCYDEEFRPVCDDQWDENEAKVACRQLGHLSDGE